jgi:hypothetical protein
MLTHKQKKQVVLGVARSLVGLAAALCAVLEVCRNE